MNRDHPMNRISHAHVITLSRVTTHTSFSFNQMNMEPASHRQTVMLRINGTPGKYDQNWL